MSLVAVMPPKDFVARVFNDEQEPQALEKSVLLKRVAQLLEKRRIAPLVSSQQEQTQQELTLVAPPPNSEQVE